MSSRQQRQYGRSRSTYPRWTEPTQCPSPVVERRPLPPLLAPVATACPNALPDRPVGPCRPPEGYTRRRHVVPAAYPRSLKESTGSLRRASHPFSVAQDGQGRLEKREKEGSEERKNRQLAEARECVWQNLHATPQTAAHEGEPQLWLAAECWSRNRTGADQSESERGKSGEGLTLVVSAANGFTKETWMPTIRRLLERPPSRGFDRTFGGSDSTLTRTLPAAQAAQIDEVWFLDDYHHGQSIDLNAGSIGPVHAWADGGRDILNFIKHVLPQYGFAAGRGAGHSGKGEEAATTLPWREVGSGRKVIGIGHSVGGNAMVRAAHLAPELFHALFLVEPMTPPLHFVPEQLEVPEWPNLFFRPVVTMKRRSTWASMAEALKVRESSAFFSSWHEDVWRVWESHHLVPDTDTTDSSPGKENHGVQLATPTWAEAAVFAESTGLAEGWDTLPLLGQLPCGFLMAGEATSTMGEDITREMVWRPPMAANERIMDAGHLIVHEKPDQVADAIGRFIDTLTVRPDRDKGKERSDTTRSKL